MKFESMKGRFDMANDSNSNASSGGIGFTGLLTIVLIVLKLTGYIHWSWVWVLAPLWGGIALVLAVGLVGVGLYILSEVYKAWR